MIGVRDSGGISEIARVRVRDGGGLSDIATVRVRDVSGLHIVYSAMAAEASIPPTGYANSGGAEDILTGNSMCTVTGGVPPYTYLWSEVSASGTWTIVQNTNDFTGFVAVAVDPIDVRTAEFKCTVTDDTGESVDSNTITATAINLGG